MIAWLNSARLTVTQWLLVSLAAAVAGLAALVWGYRKELQRTRAKLLSEHFSNEQARFDDTVAKAADKAEASRKRYQDALDAYEKNNN